MKTTKTISGFLETASNYRALVVGDSIIDEYVYVRPQGKSPKENIITYRVLSKEQFLGGVWAAAEHVKGFCKSVDVFTGADVTIKRRYVEQNYMQKVSEIHDSTTQRMTLPKKIDEYDLVIVTDFGHGFITPALIEQLTRQAQFLAVNAQTNSANLGFNLITKYPRADYVVLDELEARLAARDKESSIERVMESLGYSSLIVTLGPKGSAGYEGGVFVRENAVSAKVVDTMGAGDAFFCVTAPLAAAGAKIEMLCRVGNAAGAIKCKAVGQKAVTREALLHSLNQSPVSARAVPVGR